MTPPPVSVIVADDDADDLFFAERCLKKTGLGLEIATCANGNEVVNLLERSAAARQPVPRMIFLDVKMPGRDGFETLKWIRGHPRYREVPVVMLSGSKEARDVELARNLGANDYLVKYPPTSEFARVLQEKPTR